MQINAGAMTNGGSLAASNALNVTAASISNTESMTAGSLTLPTAALTNNGQLAATGSLAVNSSADLSVNGTGSMSGSSVALSATGTLQVADAQSVAGS